MLSGLDGPMGAVVAWGGLVAGGILLTGGAALAAVPKIAAYKVALETLGIAGSRTTSILGTLARGVGAFAVIGVAQAGVEWFANTMTDLMSPAAEETTEKVLQSTSAVEAFAGVLEARMPGTGDKFKLAAEQVAGLAEALDDASSASFWEPISAGSDALLGSWRLIGQELAATDFDSAKTQFQRITTEANLTEAQIHELIKQSPEFEDALKIQATMLGKSGDEAELFEIAMSKVGAAAEESADAIISSEEAAELLADQADNAAHDLDAMRRALHELSSEAMGMGAAVDAAQGAINKMWKSAEDAEASLYGTNDASIALRDSMRDVETRARDAGEAILDNGGDVKEAMAQWRDGRDEVIELRMAMDDSKEEAKAWANENMGSARDVKGAFTEVKESIDALESPPPIDVIVRKEEAERQLAELVRTRIAFIDVRANLPDLNPGGSGGGRPGLEDGGIIAYQDGGIASGIYRGGSPIYKFAEENVGWEAFISGKTSQLARNREVWAETGNRLGMNMQSQPVQVSFPDRVTLVDESGSILTHARVIADETVTKRSSSGSMGSIKSRFGV